MDKYKQVIVVRTDLEMSRGKLAAQCAHASLESALKVMQSDKVFQTSVFKDWRTEGAKKIVVKAESEGALIKLRDAAVRAGIKHALISDAGLTEVPPGTKTALGLGPDEEKKIDKLTGNFSAL